MVAMAHRLARYPRFSWRSDPAVPPFPDEAPLVVFDGVCVLCSGFARFVATRDRARTIRFTAAQSPLGQALMRHYGLDTRDFETNLLIADGQAHAKLEAFAGIMGRLGPPWPLAKVVLALPRRQRDWLYDRVAQNRYALLGKRETCIMPGPEWRDRVLE